MELFEIQTKNRALRMLHKILLATGILVMFYLVMKLIEGNLNSKDPSSSGRWKL